MEITYTCFDFSNLNKSIKWEGVVTIINKVNPYEFTVKARGSVFQVILGSYKHGKYICIPNYNIGCDLPEDITNTYRVIDCLCVVGLSSVNATSIADAIHAFRRKYGDLLTP